jgi:hypothetical protein
MPGSEGGEGLDVPRSRADRLPAQFGGAPRVAEKVVTLTVPKPADGPATGASAQPCAGLASCRGPTPSSTSSASRRSSLRRAFAATLVSVPLAAEAKGEAVRYLPDGRGKITTGEGANESQTGDPSKWPSVLDAYRQAYASA